MALVETTLRKLGRATHGVNFSKERNDDVVKLYEALIKEEFNEFFEAEGDAEKLKELMDLIWVCIMYGLARGWKLNDALGALVEEYKSKFYTAEGKLEPLFREDGKLMKNTGFKRMHPSKYIAKWDGNHA